MGLDASYLNHNVFSQLTCYGDFYKTLGFRVLNWTSEGTKSFVNLDTYVYSSISGTLESIRVTLSNGRINDAYALLRKYFDSTIINIYSNLYLKEHFSVETLIVKQIEGWRKGTIQIPEYRVMSNYIRASDRLKPITDLLFRDDLYKGIRSRCNAHTHYNFYRFILLNDKEIFLPDRVESLNGFSDDLDNIFILHLSYIFYLNDHYMMSSDYLDSLEVGGTPEEGSQYWVAPFVQQIFDDVIKTKRPEIFHVIKENTLMRLE